VKGFFHDHQTKKRKIRTGINKSESDRIISGNPCEECGLYKQCKSPKMNYTGQGKQKVLIVAEGSGKSEDEDWKKLGYDRPTQLIGQAGRLFRNHLKPYGLDLDVDFWKINSVNCRTPDNRKPSKKEIKCCRFMVDKAIEELKPEMIWLLGGAAVESFYQGIYSNLEINTWRKLCIPDSRSGAWIIPLFHPSYLLRNEGNRNLESTFERDLKWAVSCIGKEKPEFIDFGKQVTCLYTLSEVLYALEVIERKEDPITFDYEATSLKPYGEGNKIWSIAVNGYSFPYDYPHWKWKERLRIQHTWIRLLKDEKILKIAHNLKFEDQWSRAIFDIPEVKGWHWCTMNAAHIIDARKYYTSLNFQGLINFGVLPYDQDVKKHIKSGSKFNTLDQVPLEKLLLYGGIDERITSALWAKQEKFLSRKKELKRAYQFFHKGLLALSDAQGVGICIDKEYYLEEEKELTKKIEALEYKILNGKEAKLFERKFKRKLKLKKEVSTKDLRDLFFGVMEMRSVKKTNTGLESVDEEVLNQMDNVFAKRIIQRRKLFKILSYINQYKKEEVDGKIHPFIDLHIARSYRSASSNPNFQNIPVRDEQAKAAIRRGIVPSKGRKIGSADYSGMEICGAACYSKDPVLVKEIEAGVDVHHNLSKKIFLLNDKQTTKDLRFYTKNQFVFPEFYGSYYKNCAYNLQDNCYELETKEGVKVRDHLKDKGIKTSDDFVEHVQKIEKDFWEKYHVYDEWKEKRILEYQKKGYVDTFFGHRRGGFLTNNQLLNTPIQGTSFHWLLWSFIELNDYAKMWWDSNLIAQIHDELLWDLDPDEEEEIWKETKYIMTEKIREENDWIIVPLKIDIETTEVDCSWYTKEKIEI